MKDAASSHGPVFATDRRQSNPSKKIHDLGIQMKWGTPEHVARLYRNFSDHAPHAFTFDHVVIHEDDVLRAFDYQPSLSRKTAVGTFYPLAAYLLELYLGRDVDRNIFSVLADLDRILPQEQFVTSQTGNGKARTQTDMACFSGSTS